MKIRLHKLADNLIWILTVFILVAYLVFETYAWGRYAYLGASLAILLLSANIHRGKIAIKAVPYYGFMLMFIAFTAFSSLWALNMADTMVKALTITLILLCNIMLYVHYQYEDNVERLLLAVMWAGYIVVIYTIVFYGFDLVLLAAESKRLENDFSNVNTIGMAAAIACVIQTHGILYKTSRRSAAFMIPCIIVIAASQSRKALVLLALGVFLVFFLKNQQSKNILVRIAKILFVIAVAFGVLTVLYALPIFDGVRIRMNRMIAGFLGEGNVDASTIIRQNMAALGWEWFLKYPICGIGIGTPHILAGRYLAEDTYLHNNFVELLCGGGVIGFAAYYSMYVYLFLNLFKYRAVDRKHYEIGLVWLLLMLVMDYGMVSYFSKAQWFYLMIHFLNVAAMKRKDREIWYAYEKNPEGRNQIP